MANTNDLWERALGNRGYTGSVTDKINSWLSNTEDSITYDVKGFGATGDGTTDDAVAIQAALDAANTAGGGVVYFPKGTYLIGYGTDTTAEKVFTDDGIDVDGTSNYFDSDGTINFTDYFVVGDAVRVSGFTDSNNNGDFNITAVAATRLTVSETALVTEGPGDTVTFRRRRKGGLKVYSNTTVRGTGRGSIIKVKEQAYNDHTNDQDYRKMNHFTVPAGESRIIIENLQLDGNCTIQADGTANWSGAAATEHEGIDVIGDTGIATKDIIIRNCYIHDIYNEGIDFDYTNRAEVRDCLIENCGGNGIHSGLQESEVTFTGNRIDACGHNRKTTDAANSNDPYYGGITCSPKGDTGSLYNPTITDLTFSSTDNSITTGGSVDFTNYFQPGDYLTISGTVSNNLETKILTVTATVLTVNDDCTNETPASTTLTKDRTGRAVIANNTITNCPRGMTIADGLFIEVMNNIIQSWDSSDQAINCSAANQVVIANNNIYSQSGNTNGIYIDDNAFGGAGQLSPTSGGIITGNSIRCNGGATGIFVNCDETYLVTNNSFPNDCDTYAIRVKGAPHVISGNYIAGKTATQARGTIHVESDAPGTKVINNTIDDFGARVGQSIYVDAIDCIVSNNYIDGSGTANAIEVEIDTNASNCIISSNRITGGTVGIQITGSGSYAHLVDGNQLTGCTDGLLDNAADTTIGTNINP